jgi:preprotein translocase subunit SecE
MFQMDKVRLYLNESYRELTQEVSWPTWANLQQSTVVVLVSTLVIAFLIFLMDSASNQLMKFLYNV